MANNFYLDSRGITSIRVELQKVAKQIPGATKSALNRTVDFTVTKTAKEVTNEYSIKKQFVTKTIKKVKARGKSLYAYISSRGGPLPLGNFSHTPKNFNSKAKAVKVKIKKNEGYKTVKTSPKAFVQKIYGSEADIYKRKDNRRFPVIKLRSISVPQMINNEKIISSIQEAAGKKLQERINHEIKWRLDKAAASHKDK